MKNFEIKLKEIDQIGVKVANFDFKRPFFEIRHLPAIC